MSTKAGFGAGVAGWLLVAAGLAQTPAAAVSTPAQAPVKQPTWLMLHAPWFALAALVLGVAALLVALLLRSRKDRLLQQLADDVGTLKNNVNDLMYPKSKPEPASRRSQGKDSGQDAAFLQKLEACTQQQKRLEEQLAKLHLRLDRPSPEVVRVQQSLDGMAKAVLSASGDDAAAGAAGASTLTPEEAAQALAAVVNCWLVDGAKGRATLLTLCNEVGLRGAQLATIREPAPAPLENGQFQCAFDTAVDGSWLLCKLPGTQEVLAAPADAQFLGMGTIPYQLDQMFDGMQRPRQGFRFEMIASPCILRASRDGYTVSQRGALRLEGAPAAANAPRPPAFASLVRSRASRRAPTLSAEPVDVIAHWIQQIQRQVSDYGQDLGQLLDKSATPPPVTAVEMARLTETVTRQQRDLEAMRGQIVSLNAARSAKADTTPHASAPPLPPTQSALRPAPASATPRLARDATLPGAPVVQEKSTASIAEARSSLPLDWRDLVQQAAARPESDPGVLDVPTPELFVRRLRSLRDVFQAGHPELSVAVVHVKKASGSNQVELHATRETETGSFFCQACGGEHTWQLALAGGSDAADLVFLLFPSGLLGRSNFAPGYAALVDDTGTTSFDPGTHSAAQLKRQNAQSGTFVVLQKMTPLAGVAAG